jgi:hypothetical protein
MQCDVNNIHVHSFVKRQKYSRYYQNPDINEDK